MIDYLSLLYTNTMQKKIYTITSSEETMIITGRGALGELAAVLRPLKHTSFFILCDSYTVTLFDKQLKQLLEPLSVPVHHFVIEKGEESKNMQNIVTILDAMVKSGSDKRAAIIALGGGVVGDIATMLSGLYYRGINCIQIPTTLLSQVDSSLGGKGGVNLHEYKNMIGIIKQPRAVIIDTEILDTLPDVIIVSGMGEALKYAFAYDKAFFEEMQQIKDFAALRLKLPDIVARCGELKMAAVEKDPLDKGNVRIALNFGHTLGHAIELTTHVTHGEGVAIGMVFAIKLSMKLKMLEVQDGEAMIAILKQFSLPTTVSGVTKDEILSIMKKDKKAVNGVPRFVLLEQIGKAVIKNDVPLSLIEEILDEVIL